MWRKEGSLLDIGLEQLGGVDGTVLKMKVAEKKMCCLWEIEGYTLDL